MKITPACTEISQPSAKLYQLIATSCPCCTVLRAITLGFAIGALVGWASGPFWVVAIVTLTVALIFVIAEFVPIHGNDNDVEP